MRLWYFSRSSRCRRRSLQVCYKQRRSKSYPWGSPALQEYRRRFSHASDALSSAMGWPAHAVHPSEVVAQGRTMCVLYIRACLNQSGTSYWKWGIQESLRDDWGRSVVGIVFPELLSLGQELERLHPALYTGVSRQASSTSVLASEKAVNTVVTGVAQELANSPLTWAKVVSLFAVTGGLAVDCVTQGHPELLQSLVESLGEALDEHMAEWIALNGGWLGLHSHLFPSYWSFNKRGKFYTTALTSLTALVILWLITYFIMLLMGE